MRWRQRVFIGVSIAAAMSPVVQPAAATAAPLPKTVTTAMATATTTALTASPASSSYDSPVMFTAHVSAPSGTPAGSVIFTDTSNGSILDTATLSSGTASFSTAALAPGTRSIVARYGGSSTFSPSSSAAVRIPVAAAGSPAVTYQTDPRHDGDQAQGTLKASSLTRKWTVTLGGTGSFNYESGAVSYPLIARGRVFVTVENAQTGGSKLYALNASTGAIDWTVGLGGMYGFSALAYDGGRVFAVNFSGILTAFAASTGQELWAVQLGQSTAPPTAYDGVVYASTSGVGGTVFAVSEADGVIRWGVQVLNGDESSPAVDDTGAYVSYACQQDYRFSLSGARAWYHSTSCEGGGGSTPVLHGSSLYTRGATATDTPLILSKSAGTLTGTFASATTPAFDGTSMYTLWDGNLAAVDPSGSPNRWTFRNGSLVTAPVVNGGVVYAGSSSGKVYGLSASSGAKVWTGTAGPKILKPDEFGPDVLTGMAIGGGLLVVPAGNQLTAFGG